MTEAIRQIHNMAMELSDMAKVKSAKDGQSEYFKHYLAAAYDLELYAAMKIKEVKNEQDRHWKATLLRSAGWIAYQLDDFYQAQQLAILGLQIKTDPRLKKQLQQLLEQANEKLAIGQSPHQFLNEEVYIIGLCSAANLETKVIGIKSLEGVNYYSVSVPDNQIQQVAQLFLGKKVAIKVTKDDSGLLLLEDIRWAA